jgi:glutamyl-tRNA synthetase
MTAASSKAAGCRVRFAPSPTGHLHLGSLRSALFNWLFARHNNGTFLLRIEDTDLERSKDEYTKALLDALAWCGLQSDEPLVIQSQRLQLYKQAAAKLLAEGKAYRCTCSKQELANRLGTSAAEGGYTLYDGHCRNKVAIPDTSVPFAVRFAMPDKQEALEFDDLIRGLMSYARNQFDDFIIVRSDGMPTYNFSVVIDDAAMHITHIIRGEEHLINTPRQIELYKAFGWEVPAFAHIPLILGPTGAKLSKRDCATAVTDYMKAGFLPQALCNYLVRLGWSHGDQEIFTTDELINYFDLDQVGKKGAIFDNKKLDWVNSVYLKQADTKTLWSMLKEHIDPAFQERLSFWSDEQIATAIKLYQARAVTGSALYAAICQLYDGQFPYAETEIALLSAAAEPLSQITNLLAQCSTWDKSSLEQLIKAYCKEQNVPLANLGKPLRYALTGSYESPGIFELLALLGRNESMLRIERLMSNLKTH